MNPAQDNCLAFAFLHRFRRDNTSDEKTARKADQPLRTTYPFVALMKKARQVRKRTVLAGCFSTLHFQLTGCYFPLSIEPTALPMPIRLAQATRLA